MQGQGNMHGFMGCQASGPMGGMGGMCGPAQAMGGKGCHGGLPGAGGFGSMGIGRVGMQHPSTIGGHLGFSQPGGFGTQAMSNPGWGQPMSSMGGPGHAPLGGYNGNMPFHAMTPGARPGKQGMAGKRPATGFGQGMKRKFATQCQTYAQIPVNFKMEVLQTIYPEVWNPVTSVAKTMVDMDSSIAIGFDRWPGSPVETRCVTGLI